ncbi:MAG: Asp-tRNA(Asn)/Glu-tRNA(Gln) amidotransferase GatCAB subunit B [Spirochaetes bacterium]|nr:MAG: Asp-tRNA(Asn)/Glu-tRNA(Gln) amidotransferase GatCAB subunit B [Spirochaetota bacterium]
MKQTKYQTFIGLEVHIHLITESKVFCSCRNVFGSEPNTNVCPVCMGYPGVLPSLNEEAVKKAYQVAMALNCHLNEKAVFERKNYFYPDMPKNYQISQFEYPFGINGYFDLELTDGSTRKIRIHDVHLEEDAGKMIHEGSHSKLDYNRAGTPLLEIVTEPDLVSGEEAEAFVQQFRQMVRYLGVTDGNMEEGSLRCDANVSINEHGKGLGTKTECKNLNSSRFIKKALEYEIKRQAKVLNSGEKIIQETRLWDESVARTSSMRTKESSNDYRYFPEPDLPPYRPKADFLEMVKSSIVELPGIRKKRIEEEYGLNEQQAVFITGEKDMADFFENTVFLNSKDSSSTSKEFAATAASWLSGNVQKILNDSCLGISESCLSPERLFAVLKLIENNTISAGTGKKVLAMVFEKNEEPGDLVDKLGLAQVSDTGEIEKVVSEIVDANPKVADAIREGADKQIGFLMGQVMKATSGKANPGMAQKLIRKIIFK